MFDSEIPRWVVPGGWVYSVADGAVFVPYPSTCEEGHLVVWADGTAGNYHVGRCARCDEMEVSLEERTGVEWVAHS